MRRGPEPALAAIVVANWNGETILPRVLGALAAQDYPVSVVVVDNGSTDSSVEVIRHHHFAALELGHNRGLAGALAAGALSVGDSDYIIFLNSDVSFPSDFVRRAVLAMDASSPDTFAISFVQRHPSTGEFVHQRILLSQDTSSSSLIPGWGIKQAETAVSCPTLYASAAGCIVRTSQYFAIGGWDTSFFLGWEDIDLSLRAWRRGLSIKVDPTLIIEHDVSSTVSTSKGARLYARGVVMGRLIVAFKYWPYRVLLRVLGRTLIGIVSAAIALEVHGARDRVRGAQSALRHTGVCLAERREVRRGYGSSTAFIEHLERVSASKDCAP